MEPLDVQVEATVRCPDPDNHLIEVTLRFPTQGEAGDRRLWMPRWIPGSYKIRDFARFVQDLEIKSTDGRRIPYRRESTDSWTFRDPGKGILTVRYRVYCRDLTVDTSHVTSSHLYVHGVTAFLYDDDTRSVPWRVTVEVPKGWRIWSGLPAEGEPKYVPHKGVPRDLEHKAVFLAPDYDELVDCPIEAGPDHHEVRFRAAGKPHRLVVWNPPEGVDWKKVADDLGKLVEETAAVFGGLPYDDYTFIAHVAKGHGGGLEHKNSTVLGVDPLHLTDPKLYQTRWLALCAHEFFHVWNVRRIQPSVFIPFDYQQEVPTGLLWLFEGGTSYFEIPLMLRAKIAEPEKVYEVLAQMVQYLEMVPGRHKLSVSDASRLTWTKLYQRHESNINTNISYYTKGAIVALVLDAHLRERGHSLDEVMRYLWDHYGARGLGVPEDGLGDIILQATGIDVRRQLQRWVEHPGDVPLDAALRSLGLLIERKHSDEEKRLGLGINFDEEKMKVTSIPDRWETKTRAPAGDGDLPAAHPLDPDDEIVAVDGWKVTAKDLKDYCNRPDRKAGDVVQVTVFRDGRLRTLPVPLVERTPDKIVIKENKTATPAQKKRLAAYRRSRVRPARTAKKKAAGTGRAKAKRAT